MLNDSLTPVSISNLFTYDSTYVRSFLAEKYGKLIHVTGLISNAPSNFIITIDKSISPRSQFSSKALNYSGWNYSSQRQVNVVIATNGTITLDCDGTYPYTFFDIWYLTN